MNIMFLVTAGLVTLAVVILFIGFDIMARGQTTEEQRVKSFIERQGQLDEGKGKKKSRRFGGRDLSGLPFNQQLATELAQADLKVTPTEFLILNIALAIGGFVFAYIVRGDLLVALAIAGVGAYAPRLYLNFKKGQRFNQFANQLGDTLILIANSLRTGYSLQQSLDTVSKELAPPISVEFGRVTREIGLGLTINEALANLLRRIPSPDLDLVVTAIIINHEVGGNLSEILDTIAYTIRERIRIQGDIRALTSMQRMSGNILALLPIVLGFGMYAMNPGYISGFWTGGQAACGITMLVVGAIMIGLGYLAIMKLAAIEV